MFDWLKDSLREWLEVEDLDERLDTLHSQHDKLEARVDELDDALLEPLSEDDIDDILSEAEVVPSETTELSGVADPEAVNIFTHDEVIKGYERSDER